MALNFDAAVERALDEGDEWQSWRALRLSGDRPPGGVDIAGQDQEGAFVGPGGRPSPGATGEALCHLSILGLGDSGPGVMAAEWLERQRTPARAWLDPPTEVPGDLDTPGGARVWATAAASCGLLAVGRDPGPRALDLLRGEADNDGRFTGGAYPTFAAAGAYWLAEGATTEMAEWGLRWARESDDDRWGPWERASALTFWTAAGVPLEHPTVETFVDELRDDTGAPGWVDLGLTLRALEVIAALGA